MQLTEISPSGLRLLSASERDTVRSTTHGWTFMVRPVGHDGSARTVLVGTARFPSYYPGPSKAPVSLVLSRPMPTSGQRKVIAMRTAESDEEARKAAELVIMDKRSGYGPHRRDPLRNWVGMAERDIWIDDDEDN